MFSSSIKHNIFAISLVVMISSLAGITFNTENAYAQTAGCRENAGKNDQCYWDNYNNISDKQGISRSEFEKMADSCRGGGGIVSGRDEGSCSNAVASCIQHAIDIEKCRNNDKIVELAGCANGDVTKCQGKLNMEDYSDYNNELKQNILDTCTVNAGSDVEDRRNCELTYENARKTCEAKYNTYAKGTKEDFGPYQQCMQQETLNSTRTKAECEGRGGTWVGSAGSNRCKTAAEGSCISNGGNWQASSQSCGDTKEWCEKRGGTWTNIDSSGNGGAADGCSVSKPEDENSGQPTGPEGPNPDDALNGGAKRCGQAKTNLISCGEDEGAAAINNLLIWIVRILSIGVGIAAVGGILYGAILYAAAQDNSAQTKKAVEIIMNTVIGLLLYMLMVALVNWLVPGGVIA